MPRPVTRPRRAQISWIAAMRGNEKSMVHSIPMPNCAPTCEYVAMPLGSSSAAPVIKPGPSLQRIALAPEPVLAITIRCPFVFPLFRGIKEFRPSDAVQHAGRQNLHRLFDFTLALGHKFLIGLQVKLLPGTGSPIDDVQQSLCSDGSKTSGAASCHQFSYSITGASKTLKIN